MPTISIPKQLHPDWLVGASKEEKDKLAEDLRKYAASSPYFKILKTMCQRKLEAIQSQEDGSVNQYSQTDWAFKQAHYNGSKQMLKWLDQVLSIVEE